MQTLLENKRNPETAGAAGNQLGYKRLNTLNLWTVYSDLLSSIIYF
jgi:hypothetical protein